MKKLYYTILATAAALTTASCVDLLNTAPENQIASENMWTTPELALKGMNGLYETFYNRKQSNGTQVRSENLDGLNKYGIEALGFCTDYYANNYPIYLLYNQAKRANDWQLAHEWRFCYTIVHAANDAVTNLHKAGLDAPTYERYLCEARFLRAWAYSRLNKFWQGVPVYLEPISNEQCTRTQESAEYVWREVVLPDLKYCIDNASFPDNTLGESNFGRPSKGAAYALRGMAYMWLKEWQNAANDFEQVGQCGYDLWRGEYIDFFSPDNERDNEMIFAIQYDEESGYCDNIQQAVGARDTYGGWDEVKPASDFVDYYQNDDGTEFKWSQVTGLENWDQLTPRQRAVFFCRDGLKSNAKLASQKTQAIGICGQDIFDRYYLDNGNEARIKAAYENRDPRLKQTIVTPYEPVDCFAAGLNGDENMIGKQLRWPLYLQGTSGGDFWLDKRTSAYYCYRKYVRFLKGELIDRQRCYTDFPLIRYTDVILQWAEALIELKEFTPAKNLIDQVRTRAHMPGITIGDLDAMREAVRYERRVEFPVEAVNFFDEVRWGTYKETKSPGLRRGGVHTPEPADNPEGRQPETKPFHIMVVEDTPDLREFLVKNFEDTYGVLSAKNGAEALAILEQQACDLIISDALMPEMDGFDLLMKVRNDEMLCHIPFILLSVVDSVDSKIKGLEYGADVYIEKPFSLGYVKATVESLLENRKRAFHHFASRPGFQYEKDDMGRNDRQWLDKLTGIVRENLTCETLSVDLLTEKMALSRSSLQRKLKGLTGVSPNEYIQLVRLKTAAQLLRSGEYRISEVCYLTGFSSMSWFAKCFTKQFGMRPKDFIRQNQDGKSSG